MSNLRGSCEIRYVAMETLKPVFLI